MSLSRRIALSLLVITLVGGCKSSAGPEGGSGEPRKGSIQVSGSQVELKGFIEVVDAARTLTVFGHTVLVADTTQIENERQQHIEFEALIVGMWLEVHGQLQPDDKILAYEIEVSTRDD